MQEFAFVLVSPTIKWLVKSSNLLQEAHIITKLIGGQSYKSLKRGKNIDFQQRCGKVNYIFCVQLCATTP